MSFIDLTINGETVDLPAGSTVRQLIEHLGLPAEGRGVAVAVDEEVVHRSEWAATVLKRGQRVEVVTATQGG